MNNENALCQISGREYRKTDLVFGSSIRQDLLQIIKKEVSDFNVDGYISHEELNRFRQLYVRGILETELGELTELESEVLNTLNNQELLSRNIEDEAAEGLTLGQRLADHVARFGGSWTFIISFFSFMMLWIVLNIIILVVHPFDPYPFILLNLVLSCLAAIQAPIIMMSQNRQESKDRLRSLHDYQVNLKSELEIRQLHEKMDHLIRKQMIRVLEGQEVQSELLQEVLDRLDDNSRGKM